VRKEPDDACGDGRRRAEALGAFVERARDDPVGDNGLVADLLVEFA
jgi:hypothetical protein